jgi:aminoglycoside phosphotransferase
VTAQPGGAAGLSELVARSGFDATGRAGEPATSIEYRVDAERTVQLLADVLAGLHATELDAGALQMAVDAGQVADEAAATAAVGPEPRRRTRSAAYAHVSDDRLVEILLQGAPAAAARQDRRVLTHGSPTLAHLWCDRGSAVGLVDWGRAAVADPYRDLAVAARSVATEMAPILITVLFERYGERSPDPVRLDWYSLAAELLVPSGAAPQ